MNKAQQKKFDLLYQEHLNALHRQGKAASTIDMYARALRRITTFYNRPPDRLNVTHLKDYFANLISTHSWSTVTVDRNGLQFFYKHVLNKKWAWVDIVKPPRTRTLPDILTINEVEQVINTTHELRYQTFILAAYSMGLRLGEALNLKIGDIDSKRMKVHVRLSKGRKSRIVCLPQTTLIALREYWSTHRNPKLIFPKGLSHKERHQAKVSMPRTGIQKAIRVIVKEAGIHKTITLHSFRHCYGAHLVEEGLNLRAIQKEMGHESVKTTALYTQLTEITEEKTSAVINRLIDRLDCPLDGGQ